MKEKLEALGYVVKKHSRFSHEVRINPNSDSYIHVYELDGDTISISWLIDKTVKTADEALALIQTLMPMSSCQHYKTLQYNADDMTVSCVSCKMKWNL